MKLRLLVAVTVTAMLAGTVFANAQSGSNVQSRDQREQVGAPPEGGPQTRRIEGPGGSAKSLGGKTTGQSTVRRHHVRHTVRTREKIER
jgi:hypothetical protein